MSDEAAPSAAAPHAPDPIAVQGPPVVGIGASAGGLEALKTLLQGVSPGLGWAFVVIQHLDPKYESNLADILARSAHMPVVQVKDGMPLEPNRVYVVPPNALMRLEGGALVLSPRHAVRGLHMPIDHFFRSIARSHGSLAMGIVLSGTGVDGTLGIEEIKYNGGITFAQDEKTARFGGMPRSAAASGAVDFVLPVEEIARELARLARHPHVAAPAKPGPPPGPYLLERVFRLLRGRQGVDFSQYKGTTTLRRITRRMTLRGMDRLEDYAAELERKPAELDALYHDLLIKVTGFFRDPETFEALQRKVIPAILKDHPPREAKPIRIWVPGCATGEEAYSIAICFLECLGDRAPEIPLRLFATDVDDAALHRARTGTYAEAGCADISPDRLASFFFKTAGGYQIKKFVRDQCTFARHDLVKDPPFSNLDLISCRNLLIYFDASLQKRVLPTFHYALNPKGFLSLGVSEGTGTSSNLFNLLDKKQKIYTKAPGSGRVFPPDLMPRTSWSEEAGPARPAEPGDKPYPRDFDVYKEADRALLTHYGPAGVLINEHMEILQFRGDTGRYLLPSPGKASLNLLKMAREGLLVQIKAAVEEAKKRRLPARREGLRVRYEGRSLDLSLGVIPIRPSGDERHYMVLFEEDGSRRPAKGKKKAGSRAQLSQESGLRQELAAAKEHLESTIERQDVTNEELKAANEEILSSNEEMQSTNEELETAKEELQSTNEELTAANEGIRQQNLDLTEANNDLNNLFSSASLPVLMVDGKLRIRRFTGMVDKVLNVIPSDVGRPLRDFQLSLDVPGLERILTEVISRGVVQEREVQDPKGHWYSLRIQPYKTEEGKVDGAVLSFIGIDSLKGVEKLTKSLADLRLARNYSEGIVQTVRESLLTLDADLRVLSANEAFFRTFRVTREETMGRPLHSLGGGRWDVPGLRDSLGRVLSADAEIEDFEFSQDFPGLGPRVVLLNAKRIVLDGAGTKTILVALEDITERRRSDALIRSSLAEKEVLLKEVHHRVKNNLQIMSSLLKLRFDTAEDGRMRAFIQESLDRIQAIALVHERLYNADNVARIDMNPYIRGLVDSLLLSGGKPGKVASDVRVEDLRLGPDAAIPCGLIVNELISNALKHAFPGERKGSVSVALRREPGGNVLLELGDDGVGLPAGLDISKSPSMGLRLVQQMVSQLGGRLDISRSSGGTAFAVRFPIHPEGDDAGTLGGDEHE